MSLGFSTRVSIHRVNSFSLSKILALVSGVVQSKAEK